MQRPEDPQAGSGLAALAAMIAGQTPPPSMATTLGFTLVAVDHGRAVFRGEPTEAMLNPQGTVHGGWAATILDSAMGCAVHTVLAPGEAYTTLEIKVNFTRATLPGRGVLTATGTLIHRGRRTATSEARLTDPDGKVLAHATTTCMIFQA